MPRKPKVVAEVKRAEGLYLRGNKWWIRRVYSPVVGNCKQLGTGQKDLATANAVLGMVDLFHEGTEAQKEWLDKAVNQKVKLADIYNRHRRGELGELAKQLKAKAAGDADANLDPVVEEWIVKDLDTREKLGEQTRGDYIRQVRYFIPAGVRVARSQFTEQFVRDKLAALKGARDDTTKKASSGAKRNYLTGLQQFINFAERAEVITVDPLRFAFGKHGWGPKRRSRAVYYEYPRLRVILDHVKNPEALAALALLFGSGIELGGLLDQKARHILDTMPDGRGKIIVPGEDTSLSGDDRKNRFRSERTIFVDKWAWAIVLPYVQSLNLKPKDKLWSWSIQTKGKTLRDICYRAQVAAGIIDEPPVSKKGNPRWTVVKPHNLHDARHSYCINRSLGLDGEPARSADFCAYQMGHASTQMVISIYKKANVVDQIRTLDEERRIAEARNHNGNGAK